MNVIVRAALVTALTAGDAGSQTVLGLALEEKSRAPLAGAAIRLLDRNLQVVAETRAASDGAFALTAPAAGMYRLLVRPVDGGAFRGSRFALVADSVLQYAIGVPTIPPALRAGPFADEVTRPAVPRGGTRTPRFPAEARSRGERGMVVSYVRVDSDGKPDVATQHTLSTSDAFAQAVRESTRQLRFVPAERDGRRTAQVVQLTYAFGYPGDVLDGDVIIHALRP